MRSKLERRVKGQLSDKYVYEEGEYPYHIPTHYVPDFSYKNIWVEVKGYFRDNREASKYIHIKNQYPNKKLIFIFANPNKKMPGAKVRKDGTFYTMGDWASKNGFEYYSEDWIPKWMKK